MRAASRPPSTYVAVIGEHLETIDGLQAYLASSGLTSRVTRVLRDASTLGAAACAVVIFPDEYVAAEVVARITALRAAQPRLLILLVTGAPQRFGAALSADGESLLPVVVPKPAFGWTILDAIRAHTNEEAR
jgi:hypothetical protein